MANNLTCIYFPAYNKGPTKVFDYPIRSGGLAFHGPEKRLDKLVEAGMLRKVETDKLNLPNGVHALDMPYHKWEDPNYRPGIDVVKKTDSPSQPPKALQAFSTNPSPIADISINTAPPKAKPAMSPVVEPFSGDRVMPLEGPAPDPFGADLDPDWVAEHPTALHKTATVESLAPLKDQDVIDLAKEHGFKGTSRNRAIALLVERGIVTDNDNRTPW